MIDHDDASLPFPSEAFEESAQHPRVLIVDDEPTICLILERFLEEKGYRTVVAKSRGDAEACFQEERFEAAVIDHHLPDGNALELLEWMQANELDVPVIVLTGNATVGLAVQAIQHGAEHFLTKPLDIPALETVLERTMENRRNQRQQALEKSRLASSREPDPFLGTSAAIRQLAGVAQKVASSDRPVLIQGETGSGKGVLARWIHEHSPRCDEAFVDINCASLSPEFLDSELFGHQRGAFTGATANKAGLLEVGHRGTVFLDEIGDVEANVQPKLLKVLEEKRFRRMGEILEREVNIRLVAATHHDLRQLAKEKRFREDLFFRISTLPLEIPPLRERQEDLQPLADSILKRLATEIGRGEVTLSPGALKVMERYPWPGNIRELRNVLERALLLSSADELEAADLHFETATGAVLEQSLQDVERHHIERVLDSVDGAVAAASRILGISRSTLYQKIKAHELGLSKS